MANSAWGIDLGNRALKAIRLVRDESGIRIDDFEVIEHDQILSVAGDNKESLLQSALAKFVDGHQARGEAVAVAVSGQQSFARFIKLPPVEPKKIPEIVKFEAIQQIPFPLDDVEWSYQLFQDKDSPDIEVGIFAMKKDLVNRQITYFSDLKLNVQVVQMHPLAVYNAMAFDERIGQTVMFMDSGAENTDLIIADGQTVWLRTLPIGGNTFTETLAKSFKLSFQKAEELKRNAATSKYAKQIFQAMRPVFADLVAEIQRSIGFYASVHREARIQRIIAQGATFQLPGLQKYLQQNLQLPVEKLDAFKAQPPADTKLAANLSENLISLAGAYGLALQALGEAKITSSLLPESIRRAKMWREKVKWFELAAALFLVGLLGGGARYYMDNRAYDGAQSIRDQNAKIISDAQRYANQWDSEVANKGEEDRVRMLNINSLVDYRDLWPSIMKDILSAAPENNIRKFLSQPRSEREQIQITSIHPQYWGTDISIPLAAQPGEMINFTTGRDTTMMPTVQGRSPAALQGRVLSRGEAEALRGAAPIPETPDPNATAATQKRGFVVTIRGVTPNKGQSGFVQRTLITALESIKPELALKLKKPYYVERAVLVAFGARKPPDVVTIGGFRAGGATSDVVEEDPFAGEGTVGGGGFTPQPMLTRPFGGAPRGGEVNPLVPSARDWGRERPREGYRPGGFRQPWNPRLVPPPPGPAAIPGTGELNKEEVIDPALDRPPFEKERIDKDGEFTIVAIIVLDPEPPQPRSDTSQ